MAGDKIVYEAIAKNEKNGDQFKHAPPPCPKGFGVRHLQTLLLFLCVTIVLGMKSQLGVLLVAMVDNHHLTNNTLNGTVEGYTPNQNIISSWSIYRTYDWNKSTQEIITFALFTGYTSMMIPGGLFAQKYGGKIPIVVCLAVCGVLSLAMPWIPLMGGWIAMTICRLIIGMSQAALLPCTHTLLGKWAPISERGRLSSYIYTGSQFGTILSFQISGYLASSSLGWPSAFWVFGILSLITCGLLMIFGTATPHEHPRITTEELAYIINDGSADVIPKKRKTPWRHILTSSAVWGTVAANAGSGTAYILVLTETPMYMSKVLNVDIKNNGLYSSLPYIAMYFMGIVFGWFADFLANRKIMTVANIRRMTNTIAMGVSAFFLVAFSFVQNTNLAIVLLVLTLTTHSGVHVGFSVNYIDLSPNFAGSLMSLGNCIGSLSTLLVPVVVSNIVKDDVTNQHKWQIVFLIFGAYKFLANVIFVIFVKGTVQPWNFYGDEDYELDTKPAVIQDKKTCDEKESTKDIKS